MTYEEIKACKYTLAVFSETLRLYPSVPNNFKVCCRDEVFPDGMGGCSFNVADVALFLYF